MNDTYSLSPGSVLGAAIGNGDRSLIQLLRDAGATVVKRKLRRIRNLDTAIYLQQIGILQQILQTCGHRILATALLTHDSDLAHYLLFDNNVDINSQRASIEEFNAGQTPLRAAIESHNIFFSKAALDRGARVTEYELTAAVGVCLASSGNTDFSAYWQVSAEMPPMR